MYVYFYKKLYKYNYFFYIKIKKYINVSVGSADVVRWRTADTSQVKNNIYYTIM